MARLDDAVAGRDFLVGPTCTLADVALVAYTRVAHEGGLNLAPYPGVQAWVARVEAAMAIVG